MARFEVPAFSTAAFTLLLAGCGAPPPAPPTAAARAAASECAAPARPAWITQRPANDAGWLYGIGRADSRDAAYEAAIHDLARGVRMHVSGEKLRVIVDGLVNGEARFHEWYVSDEQGVWSETVRGLVEVPPCWVSPGGQVHVLVRASAKDLVSERLEKAAEQLVAALPADASVLVVPPFEVSGITSDFGAVIAAKLVEQLRRHGIGVVRPARPGKAGLDALLAEHGADLLLYGVVRQGAEAVTVNFTALAAPGLTRVVSAATLALPAEPAVLTMLATRRSAVAGYLIPLVMRLRGTSGSIGVEVAVRPREVREGERVVVEVRSAAAGYLTVLGVRPDGGVTRLVPRHVDRPVRIEAGQVFRVPDDVPGADGEVLLAERPRLPAPERLMAVVVEATEMLPPSTWPTAVSGAITHDGDEARLLSALERLGESEGAWGSAGAWFKVTGR